MGVPCRQALGCIPWDPSSHPLHQVVAACRQIATLLALFEQMQPQLQAQERIGFESFSPVVGCLRRLSGELYHRHDLRPTTKAIWLAAKSILDIWFC